MPWQKVSTARSWRSSAEPVAIATRNTSRSPSTSSVGNWIYTHGKAGRTLSFNLVNPVNPVYFYHVLEKIERVTLSRKIIVEAAFDLRTAVTRALGADFLRRQPQCARNAMIERTLGFVTRDTADEGKTQVGHRFCRVRPAVDAEQRLRQKVPGGFLESFAHDGVHQTFAFVEMAGGLVEHEPAFGLFLDQQEFPVALDDGGDHHIRLPNHNEYHKKEFTGLTGRSGVVADALNGHRRR